MTAPFRLATVSRSWTGPPSLFANGEQGFWYDPSDFSTMFQDAAGTTPVTATGDPVGLIRDKSGRGNDASQSTSTSRPVLQQDASGYYYLSFDGVDDWLSTASINFAGTNKLTLFAGARKTNDSSSQLLVESSTAASNLNPGSFYLFGATVATSYQWRTSGTATTSVNSSNYSAPHLAVITGIGDISGAVMRIRVNGGSEQATFQTQGTGNFGNYPVYIGRRGGTTLAYNGRLYSLIVRGAATTPADIERAEAWVNSKTGAF